MISLEVDLIPMSLLKTYKYPFHETVPLSKKYVCCLLDQLGGRLDPNVPVQNIHLMRLSLYSKKNTLAPSMISLEVDLIPMSLFKISIS